MKVSFKRRREVRMGSPCRVCDLELDGAWQPKLERGDWHDITATSPNGRYVGLVRWDSRGDTPGFRVIVLDGSSRRVFRSRRISGCCQSLGWSAGGFDWATSSARRGRFSFLTAAAM